MTAKKKTFYDIILKFELAGDKPFRKTIVVDKNSLFDFNQNIFYSRIQALNADRALDFSLITYYKNIGLLCYRYNIGFKLVEKPIIKKSKLTEKYQKLIKERKPAQFISSFKTIHNAYFFQTSKYMNTYIWHKNRKNFYSSFNYAYKMVEVISGCLLEDIYEKADRFLIDNDILFLKKSLTKKIYTMHESALEILKKRLKLDERIISKLKEARNIRNNHTGHGVVEVHSYVLSTLDMQQALGEQVSKRPSFSSISATLKKFDYSIFNRVFLAFAQYKKKNPY